MHIVHLQNIEKNGRIVIDNGGKGIFFLCLLHYNDTCKVNQQFTGGGNMKYKHIVFDIDGTLIDTEYAVLHSLQ